MVGLAGHSARVNAKNSIGVMSMLYIQLALYVVYSAL